MRYPRITGHGTVVLTVGLAMACEGSGGEPAERLDAGNAGVRSSEPQQGSGTAAPEGVAGSSEANGESETSGASPTPLFGSADESPTLSSGQDGTSATNAEGAEPDMDVGLSSPDSSEENPSEDDQIAMSDAGITHDGAASADMGAGGSEADGGGAVAGGTLSPSDVCPSEFNPVEPPLVFHATLACGAGAFVPTSKPDTILAAIPRWRERDTYVAEIGPGGVIMQSVGTLLEDPVFAVDEDDTPLLVAWTESEVGLALWQPAEPVWAAEVISPGIFGEYGWRAPRPFSAFVGNNGMLRVLYSNLNLAERTPVGVWSQTIISDEKYVSQAAMVEDAMLRTRIVYRYLSDGVMKEWVDGATLDSYPTDGQLNADLAIAADNSGNLGIARLGSDGLAVTFSDGSAFSDDIIIDPSLPFLRDRCEPPSDDCVAYTCSTPGNLSPQVAATSDGTFWLAYLLRHNTYDVDAYEDEAGFCLQPMGEDRSSDELRLVRLGTDGSEPSQRWTFRTAYRASAGVRLVARGSRLFLATGTQLFVFDADAL